MLKFTKHALVKKFAPVAAGVITCVSVISLTKNITADVLTNYAPAMPADVKTIGAYAVGAGIGAIFCLAATNGTNTALTKIKAQRQTAGFPDGLMGAYTFMAVYTQSAFQLLTLVEKAPLPSSLQALIATLSGIAVAGACAYTTAIGSAQPPKKPAPNPRL